MYGHRPFFLYEVKDKFMQHTTATGNCNASPFAFRRTDVETNLVQPSSNTKEVTHLNFELARFKRQLKESK